MYPGTVTRLELLYAPRLEGPTEAQLVTLANYSLQPVPEPSSMFLMLAAPAALEG